MSLKKGATLKFDAKANKQNNIPIVQRYINLVFIGSIDSLS